MKIIIVGNGNVGFTLAEQLVQERHDITIIDPNENSLRRAGDLLDVMTVQGNGVSAASLRDAGAENADLLIAVTDSDSVNMICSLTAKNLGVKYTVARIRNPEYTSSLAELRRNMKIDMVINPESATAVEISRLLRYPTAANVETFCRGQVEMMGFRLLEDDFLVGCPLSQLSSQVKRLSLLFCAVERDGSILIPNGSFIPRAEDKLYLIGQPDSLDQFFRLLDRYAPKVRNVFMVGGGKISLYLARILSRRGMVVKLVEQDLQRCQLISEQVPNATVLCGDGTDQDLLDSERLNAADAFIALTSRDEDNLILSLYAKQKGIPKIITKANHKNYAGLAYSIGLDSVVSPKRITAAQILQVVRGMQNSHGTVMNALHPIADGKAEATEFTVTPNVFHLNKPLRELKLIPGILIAVIVRGQSVIIPEGSTHLQVGDRVIIISHSGAVLDLNDIYAGPPANGGQL